MNTRQRVSTLARRTLCVSAPYKWHRPLSAPLQVVVCCRGLGDMSGEKPLFAGKYKFVKNECFDDYLAANGVNWMIRKMISNSSPTMTIEQNGDDFVIKLGSVMSTKETKFTIGKEFEETQPNGDVFKVMPSWEGEKIVLNYTPTTKGKSQKVTRELNGKDCIVTMEIDDIVAKRIFTKE